VDRHIEAQLQLIFPQQDSFAGLHMNDVQKRVASIQAVTVRAIVIAAGAGLLVAGCQSTPSSSPTAAMTSTTVTASDARLDTRSGFLTDYARLAPVAGGEGIKCWRQPGANWRSYDKVLLSRMRVSLRAGESRSVDPADLKSLLDYFHGALVADLKPQWQLVDKAGPGVLVVRIALTDLTPTKVTDSLIGTAAPYGFVAEIGSGAATGLPGGATPYLGETGIEMQLRDGASAAVLAECEDTEVGRKYAADLNAGASGAASAWVNGYLSSFSSWQYARDACDKWAALTARRLAALRSS
jgi:Protein of unknown function (DUF3313)